VPAAEPTGPVGDDELDALFAPAAGARRIALAVSGGADSLALLHLYDRWRRQSRAPDAIVLTVDHRLRAGSAEEAAGVLAAATARGLPARILVREGDLPAAGVEAAARAARYRLLLSACRGAGVAELMLAHHRDDQAETVLMRLARGSGVFGLAGMRAAVRAGEMTIHRPFLDVPRARLAATVALAGLHPVADPMNADPRFARARLRRIMPLLEADGIDSAGLAASARRLAGVADAIDAIATDLIAAAARPDEFGFLRLDPAPLRPAPGEIARRVLARLLIAVGGEEHAPRFEHLAALVDAMLAHQGAAAFKRTLAGAIVEWRQGRFHIYREFGRDGLPAIAVGAGFEGIWDHRFRVRVGGEGVEGLTLAALGEEGRLLAGAHAGEAAAGALATLPALWRGTALIAAPLLGFRTEARQFEAEIRSILPERLAEPSRFPDFLAD
jgi:tRNA(Ile)-lysidine synthase